MSNSLYVGSYNEGSGNGIHVLDVDVERAECTVVQSLPAAVPAYMCLSDDFRYLIVASETEEIRGLYGGAVTTYQLNARNRLSLVSSSRTFGRQTCFVAAGRDRTVLAANYGEGTVSVLRSDDRGALSAAQVVISRESGPADTAGCTALVHCVVPAPGGSSIFIVDAGRAEVACYAAGDLTAAPAVLGFPPGSRPRHLVFSADGRFAYLVSEALNVIYVMSHTPDAVSPLAVLQVVPTLPAGASGPSVAAAIRIAPDQQTLIASNRGHDSIAAYSRDLGSGQLLSGRFIPVLDGVGPDGPLTENMPIPGAFPRDVAFSPDGRLLAVALQRSGRVVLMKKDDDGGFRLTGLGTSIPNPACVQFAPAGD